MRIVVVAMLLLVPTMSGCVDLQNFTEFAAPYIPALQTPIGQGEDTDLDGIPDAVELYRQENCVIANRTCETLGLQPPTVGVRDLIIAHYIPSRDVAGYSVRLGSFQYLIDEMALHNITVQVVDLGIRSDIHPAAIWDAAPFPHETEETVFWHVWVYPIPQDDFRGWFTAGQATLNWIEMKGFTGETDQKNTLMHEAYHVLLGELREENQSECEGETAHSRHPDSVLFVNEECRYPSKDRSNRLNQAEAQELMDESFENLRHMNQGVPVEESDS